MIEIRGALRAGETPAPPLLGPHRTRDQAYRLVSGNKRWGGRLACPQSATHHPCPSPVRFDVCCPLAGLWAQHASPAFGLRPLQSFLRPAEQSVNRADVRRKTRRSELGADSGKRSRRRRLLEPRLDPPAATRCTGVGG